MFKKVFVYLLEVAATLMVVFGVLTIVPGYASTDVQAKGIGQLDITEGYQVSFSYKLDAAQPDHLGSVSLIVTNQISHVTPTNVFVSFDNGGTWHSCSFEGNSDWTCDFSGESAPAVEEIYTVRIVVS